MRVRRMVDATGSVVVIGDALIDEFRTPEGSEDFVGGAALNVAVGLARLGVETTLVAMVGDDSDGDEIRGFLAEYGVHLIATPSPRGTARAISDRTDCEPRYSFNEASVERFIEFDDRVRQAIDAAPFVVVSCLRFDSSEQVALLEGAVADPQRRLLIDPNPREGMLHSVHDFVANFERVAATALLVKVGDEDAALLYNASLLMLTEGLISTGSQTVLSTAGRDGASIATASGILVQQPITLMSEPVIDTMGAGDATLASVAASLVEARAQGGLPETGDEWQAVLERAMAVAAATCRTRGALLQLAPPAASVAAKSA
ncbi:PfkB family carbohydrate kinase [Agreia bicolorata]|nr:PfkB family carbohydrate kinase [Agreia bicolorata]